LINAQKSVVIPPPVVTSTVPVVQPQTEPALAATALAVPTAKPTVAATVKKLSLKLTGAALLSAIANNAVIEVQESV
jgi:hypothetical protein